MYELNIVEMDDDTENESFYSTTNSNRNQNMLMERNRENHQPDIKYVNPAAYLKCHDRQIQRLQRDQSKRIQDYQFLKNKLEMDSDCLQQQINGIRGELQMMYEKTQQIEEMRKRLMHCEEQNVQMQIHNDNEFEALRDVMKHVCGRMDRMEELQHAEREHMEQQRQQEAVRTAMIQQNTVSKRQRQPPVRAPSARVPCPRCGKDLSKVYVKSHLQNNRCKIPSVITARIVL